MGCFQPSLHLLAIAMDLALKRLDTTSVFNDVFPTNGFSYHVFMDVHFSALLSLSKFYESKGHFVKASHKSFSFTVQQSWGCVPHRSCQLHVSPTWPCARDTEVSVQSLYWNCFQSFLISPKAELILLVLLPFLCSSSRKQLIYQMPETTLSESGMNQKKIDRMSSVKCHKGTIRAHFWPYIEGQPACPWKRWSHGCCGTCNDAAPRYDKTYVFWSRMEGMELPHHLHHQRSSNPCQ